MREPLPSPFGDDISPVNQAPIIPLGLHIQTDATTIAYRCQISGELLNALAFTLLHPAALALMLGGATLFTLVYPAIFGLLGPKSFAARWWANLALLVLVNLIQRIVQISREHNPQRGETMTLRPHELEYTSPIKTLHLRWRQIKLILNAGRYLYFVRLDGMTYVPHTAFPTSQARQLWLQAARMLQKSGGANWPADTVAQLARTVAP